VIGFESNFVRASGSLLKKQSIMKRILLIAALFTAGIVHAQTKVEQKLIAQTYLLSHTVFGTKDSLTLEKLFASNLSYGHSKGKIESRKEALSNISKNTSAYKDTAISNIRVMVQGKTAIVRHLFVGKEYKKDGTIVSLNFAMMLVWIKEGRKWKLMGRQAAALPQ
jgi:hypothetical protein